MQLFILLIVKHPNISAVDFISPVTLSLIGMRSDNLISSQTFTATAAPVNQRVVPMEATLLLKLLISRAPVLRVASLLFL